MTDHGRVVFVNGEMVPERDARISIYDSALMFGDMVFEMTRSFRGEQFKLREHLERLLASARHVRIPIEASVEELEDICAEVVERNRPAFEPDDEHRLLLNVSRGVLGLYQEVLGGHVGPNLIVADFPLRWTVKGMSSYFAEGVAAMIPSQRSIPARLLEPKVKNRSRMHYMMANVEASAYGNGGAWPLLLDPDGFVTEGTGANFFIVVEGELHTPEPRNILRGISRAYVVELARGLGIRVVERNIEPFDVHEAEEAFFTASPFCMLPVRSLNGRNVGSGERPVFDRLLAEWSASVGVDIPGQIREWDDGFAVAHDAPTPYAFKQ